MNAVGSGISGIILAAGRSRRMGRTKQLLPWPPPCGPAETQRKTVVEAAFDAISGFCNEMVVVLGHEAQAVEKALGNRRFGRADVDPDSEMIEAIKAGLHLSLANGGNPSAVIIHPADQPAVQKKTIEMLFKEHAEHPNVSVMPEYAGRGGHPVIIPANLFESLFTYCAQGGLRQLWIEHPQWRIRVPVNDQGTIADLDYPEDYAGYEAHP